ncbi:MAG: hypothetical protein ACMV0F_03380 [Trichlorobacter sp.]
MNPMTLFPQADTLTAHWGWFQFFLILTFPVHLLAMNALLGTTFAAFVAHFMPGQKYKLLAFNLGKVLPFLVAFTVNFGVAPLLFVNVLYGQAFYSSSVLMGIFWLSVIPLIIIAYYAAYLYDFSFKDLGDSGRYLLLLMLVVLAIVGFIFTNNMSLMLTPGSWSRWFTQASGTLLNLADPTLWPRYLHMITGGLAIGGLFVALYATVAVSYERQVVEVGITYGIRIFTWMTALQVLVGTWYLLSLPPAIKALFMGGDALATGLMVSGIMLSLVVLVTGYMQRVITTVLLIVPLVYVMTGIRDIVRTSTLAPFMSIATTPSVSELSPLILFLVTLVAGVVVIIWMLQQVARVSKAR